MLPCALPLCAGRTYQRGHCPSPAAAPSLCVTVVTAGTFPPSTPGGSPAAASATAWSGASAPPVGPQRPERPACGGGCGAPAGLSAPSRLPLGAVGRGGGPRFSTAARRSPRRRPPAPARPRLPAAPARRGGRRWRGRGKCGYGSGTAVAAAVTGCGNSGRNGGDAGVTGPLLVRRVLGARWGGWAPRWSVGRREAEVQSGQRQQNVLTTKPNQRRTTSTPTPHDTFLAHVSCT